MLKISDFSKLSRISIRMLRFYDEKEILKPTIVKDNGYRYYEAKQLRVASHIQYLRYLGFSTDEIKNILSVYQNREDITKYLQLQLENLKDENEMIVGKIEALTKTIQKMNQEEIMMNYQVEVKQTPEKYMVCKRGMIPSYDKEGLLWEELCKELAASNMNVQVVDSGATAVFHDQGYKEEDVDVEIRQEVKGKYKDTENFQFKTIESIQVASVTFTGGYENISEVSYHIAKWISEHNYEICGPNFCVYHLGYAQTRNPEEFVTEICYPIK